MINILNFFKKVFSAENIKYSLFIILILMSIFLFKTCKNLNEEKLNHKRDITMYENNLTAMNDTIRTYYDKKLDKMISEKTSYLIKSVDDLKKYNESMYNDFKGMKNMVAGIKSDVSIIIPSMRDELGRYLIDKNDSTKFTIPWNFNYADEGLSSKIMGKTQFRILDNKPTLPIISTIDSNIFNIKLRYAVTDENGKYLVKAFSPSKLVKFTEIDGALSLDKAIPEVKKSNSFSFGPYVGLGVNSDISGKQMRFGWSVGVGVSYNIFSKKK